MKRIKRFIFMLLIVTIFPLNTHAASANISIAGNASAVVGNKITLTVTLSAGASWEMDLDYDRNYLQFVSGGGEAGGMNMVNTSTGRPNRTYTFTFKVLKSGNTTVRISRYYVVADDFSAMNVSGGSKSIRLMTQAELQASYSKDNNLKSLSVEGFEISPAFNRDTLEYSVNVPEGTEKINILAAKNDGTATVTGAGEVEVSPGTNAFEIVVKAQNGAEKVYKINVNVIDENPVHIKIGKKEYTLVKYKSEEACPAAFEDSEIEIETFKVPACVNKTIGYTLVMIKDEEGKFIPAVYKSGKYELYSEIIGNSLTIIPENFKGKIKGYKKQTIKINDIEVEAYKIKKDSKFSIIYGLNLTTGEHGYYQYDEVNKSFTAYDNEYIEELENMNNYYLIAVIIFGGSLLLSIIALISNNNKHKKKNKKAKVEEKDAVEKEEPKVKKDDNKKKNNEIIEVNNKEASLEETGIYDILKDDKKKKNKKK